MCTHLLTRSRTHSCVFFLLPAKISRVDIPTNVTCAGKCQPLAEGGRVCICVQVRVYMYMYACVLL